MKTRYKILLIILVILASWSVLTAPIYQQERPCDVGFEDTIIGYCVPRIFMINYPSDIMEWL